MNRTTALARAALIGALVAACGAPAAMAKDRRTNTSVVVVDDGAKTSSYSGTINGREYSIEIRDGSVTRATLDGKSLPTESVKIEDGRVALTDENGAEIASFKAGGAADRGPSRAQSPAKMRPIIGITMGEVDWTTAEQLGLNPADVVVIGSVSEGLPADKAGLKQHDIVTRIDGAGPVTEEKIAEAVRSRKAGDTLTLTVLRKGKPQDIAITVEERPSAASWERWVGDEGTREEVRRAIEEAQRAAAAAGRAGAESGRALANNLRGLGERMRLTWRDEVLPKIEHSGEKLQETFERERERLAALFEGLKLSQEQRDALEAWVDKIGDAIDNYVTSLDLPEIHLIGQGNNGRALVVPSPPAAAPAAPPAPVAPGSRWRTPAPQEDAGPEDVRRLERRLAEMEQMLRELTAQKAAESGKNKQ